MLNCINFHFQLLLIAALLSPCQGLFEKDLVSESKLKIKSVGLFDATAALGWKSLNIVTNNSNFAVDLMKSASVSSLQIVILQESTTDNICSTTEIINLVLYLTDIDDLKMQLDCVSKRRPYLSLVVVSNKVWNLM